MHYQEFKPSKQLESYVKCYYLYESSADLLLEDRAFATGCIELMFKLPDFHPYSQYEKPQSPPSTTMAAVYPGPGNKSCPYH